MRIRIPGATLITIRRNPSGEDVCALTLPEGVPVQGLSRFTGGSEDTTEHSAHFSRLANMVGQAFESSPLRNKQHPYRLEPYQKVGIAFGLVRKGRAGLFDPMGLGKTVQAIGLAMTCPDKYLPMVIFCPRNAIGAWKKQLGYLSGRGTAEEQAAESQEAIKNAWVKPGALNVTVITDDRELEAESRRVRTGTNYALIIQKDRLMGPVGPSDASLDAIVARLTRRGLLVVDEGHYYKNPMSSAFVRLHRLASTAAHVLVLTGTPAMITVTDTLPLMALIDPKGEKIPELIGLAGGRIQSAATRLRGEIEEEDGKKLQRVGGMSVIIPKDTTAEDEDEEGGAGGVSAPWINLQNAWIDRHAGAGSSVGVPEAAGKSRDFGAYTLDVANGVQDEFRQLALRRSRRSVKESKGAEHLGIQKKDRALVLVPDVRGQISAPNEDRTDFFERAAMLREIDVMALETRLGRAFQGMTPSQVAAAFLATTEGQAWQSLFERRTRQLKSAVGSKQKIPMGLTTVDAAVARFAESEHAPIIYFTYHNKVAETLIPALWKAYSKVPNFRLFVYADKEGEVTGLTEKGFSTRRLSARNDPRTELENIALNFGPKDFERPNVLVMSYKGKEGVDLPGGVEVVFVERFVSPGEEEQAEDRINRANRSPAAPAPRIRYYMPDHFTAYALLNRIERRRASAQRTYGEDSASDYSTNLALPDDPNPLSRDDYLRRSFMAEADLPAYIASRVSWAQTLPLPNPYRRRNPALSLRTASDYLSALQNVRDVRIGLGLDPEPEEKIGDGEPPPIPCSSKYTVEDMQAMVARASQFGVPLTAVAIGRTAMSPPCYPVNQRLYRPRVTRSLTAGGALEPVLAGFKDEGLSTAAGVELQDLHGIKLTSPFTNEEAQSKGIQVLLEATSMWAAERSGAYYPDGRRSRPFRDTDKNGASGYVTFLREVNLPGRNQAELQRVYGRPIRRGRKYDLRGTNLLDLDRAEVHATDPSTGQVRILGVPGILGVEPLSVVSGIEHVPPHSSSFNEIVIDGSRASRLELQAENLRGGEEIDIGKAGTEERETKKLGYGFRIEAFGHPEHPREWSRSRGQLSVESGGSIRSPSTGESYPLRKVKRYRTGDYAREQAQKAAAKAREQAQAAAVAAQRAAPMQSDQSGPFAPPVSAPQWAPQMPLTPPGWSRYNRSMLQKGMRVMGTLLRNNTTVEGVVVDLTFGTNFYMAIAGKAPMVVSHTDFDPGSMFMKGP